MSSSAFRKSFDVTSKSKSGFKTIDYCLQISFKDQSVSLIKKEEASLKTYPCNTWRFNLPEQSGDYDNAELEVTYGETQITRTLNFKSVAERDLFCDLVHAVIQHYSAAFDLFSLFDQNGDGSISKEELASILSAKIQKPDAAVQGSVPFSLSAEYAKLRALEGMTFAEFLFHFERIQRARSGQKVASTPVSLAFAHLLELVARPSALDRRPSDSAHGAGRHNRSASASLTAAAVTSKATSAAASAAMNAAAAAAGGVASPSSSSSSRFNNIMIGRYRELEDKSKALASSSRGSVQRIPSSVVVASGSVDQSTDVAGAQSHINDLASEQIHGVTPFGRMGAFSESEALEFEPPVTAAPAGLAAYLPPPYQPRPHDVHAHLLACAGAQSSAASGAAAGSFSPVAPTPHQEKEAAMSHLQFFGGEHIIMSYKDATARVDHFYQAGLSRGVFVLTNYRIAYLDYKFAGVRGADGHVGYIPEHLRHSADASCEVPLMAIMKVEKNGDDHLAIETKDFRRYVFAVDSNSSWVDAVVALIHGNAFPKDGQKKAFCFEHSLPCPQGAWNGWNMYDPLAEYQRLGLYRKDGADQFRLVPNYSHEQFDTYPQTFLVPAALSDADMEQIAAFRSRARVPAVVWRHPRTGAVLARCAQPNTGIGGKRCAEDERAFALLRTRNPTNADVLYIMDARPLKAAVGNRLMGKGFENEAHYEKCHIEFLNIENIHAIREALQKLMAVLNADAALQNGHTSHGSAVVGNAAGGGASSLSPGAASAVHAGSASPAAAASAASSSSSWFAFAPSQAFTAAASFASNLLPGFGGGGSASGASSAPSSGITDRSIRPFSNSPLADPTATLTVPSVVSLACPTYPKYTLIKPATLAGEPTSSAGKHGGSVDASSHASIDFTEILSHRAGITALHDRSAGADDSAQFAARVESTQWLTHVRLVLAGVVRIVQALDTEGASVVTHCSDGWDRTSQLSALSQLCLDPFYRTQRGFAVLIEKEWLSFGHKFAERCGHASADYGHDQRAPIFLQFLDCVWQITRQFPLSFEFHDRFLIEIADHMVSGAFGTFLFDCERERQESTLSRRTPSLWTWLLGSHGRCALFRNPLYRPHPGKLLPVATARRVVLWEAYFMRYDPLHREQESIADAAALMHARRIYRVDHLMALNLPPDAVLLGEDDLLDRRLAATVEMREDARAQVEDRAMAQREAHRLMSASAHMELLSDFDEGRMRLSAVNAAAADAVEAAEARKNGGGSVSSAAAASAALLAIAEGACEVEVAETDDFLIESRERDSSVPLKPAMLMASRAGAAASAPPAAAAPRPLRRMISSPDPLMAVGAGSVHKTVIPVRGSAADASAHTPQPSGPPPPPPRPSAAEHHRDAAPIPSIHRDSAPTPSTRRDVAPPPKR